VAGRASAVRRRVAVATRGAEAEEGRPRNFVNADGSTTVIPGKPQRIFSTSVSSTGTLLAIDAPVVASGSAGNGTFFAQWAALARQRKVENAWPAPSISKPSAQPSRI
jgi:iron complex transport system substrate-binding protein